MNIEYTISQLLGLINLRYTPLISGAINTLLNTSNSIDYDKALRTITKEVTGYGVIKLYNQFGEGLPTNVFGLPIYHPLILEALPETNAFEDLILESAIIEFNRSKEIVITKIQGQKKSVKEHINNGDYQISVKGMLCSKGPGYPFDQVNLFKAFMDLEQPISIIHEVLNSFDINSIVITGNNFPKSTFTNAQVYAFSGLDDEPLIINA